MSKNHFAALALASAFALITALPAAAADKPAKPAGAEPQVTTAHHAGGHGMALKSRSRLHVQRERGPKTPDFFTASAEACSFTCGDWEVTCSGSTASCDDSSCVATGGGVILVAWCEED